MSELRTAAARSAAGSGASTSPTGTGVPGARDASGAPGRAGPGGRVPVVLLVPAAVGVLVLAFPLVGLLVRAPWKDLPAALTGGTATQALRLSLLTATLATGLSVLVGVPLAWVLARARLPGRSLLRALVTLPLVLPPVVGGVALLLAFGRAGLLGQWTDRWFGVSLPFTTAGVVLAEAFVAMPFLVVSVEGALRAADPRFEEVAATLGASRWTAFRRVTLPMVAPGVVAGAVLCWARALGEFGATITFAGNFPGVTRTMPLAIYSQLQAGDLDGALALSLVMLVVSVVILAALRDRWVRSG